MKRKVKMLVSIAGLGDPNRPALDRKYEQTVAGLRKANPKISQAAVDSVIASQKAQDRYDDVHQGMPADFVYKPGEEVLLPEALAEKWEAAGICAAIETRKAA